MHLHTKESHANEIAIHHKQCLLAQDEACFAALCACVCAPHASKPKIYSQINRNKRNTIRPVLVIRSHLIAKYTPTRQYTPVKLDTNKKG